MPILSINRHPAGLTVLFLTEMWERFSYYGMRALLVLYLVTALHLSRERALAIYATYTALVYLSPILGGYLADRWLGKQRAVMAGAVVMAIGHFAMAVPALLHVALGLLVAGNGLFKPNISTTVGELYGADDRRRDAGFTIFYMGINLGALFSPLICGTLGERYGWHYGFSAAAVGMLIGLSVFVLGRWRLGEAGQTPQRLVDACRGRGDWIVVTVVSAAALAIVVVGIALWTLVESHWQRVPRLVLLVLGVGLLGAAAFATRRRERGVQRLSRTERQRIMALCIMALFVVFFWMGFEQAGGTMNLFALRHTDRLLFGWEMPASYFQSLNPLLILLLAPAFSMLWARLDRSSWALSSVVKQAIGMIVLGLGFVILAMAQSHAEVVASVSPWWLFSVYFLHTVGELCLSPIGLSMVTKLAPHTLAALLMGLWFTSMAAANYLAGTLEALLRGSGIPLYWFLVISSIGAGVVLLLLAPLLHRLMHGVR